MELVDPTVIPEWDDIALTFPEATIFHSLSWVKTLKESYGYRPVYAVWDDRGGIRGIVPLMEIKSIFTGKRGVSLPFTDFCPVLNDGSVSWGEITERLIQTGRERGWKTLELRDSEKVENGARDASFLVHQLDLSPGEEALFGNLRDSTRRNIRKSLKLGVSIIQDNGDHGMREFCRLNLLTRREHGLPPQPPLFFSRLFENIIAKGNGRILLARYENAFIAAAVFLSFNGQAVYKFGASEKSCQHLRPNNLLMWEAIKQFSGEGMKSLHFGKTNFGHEGLLQFKRGWGAVERPLSYQEYSLPGGNLVPSKDLVFGIHNKVFSRMPLPVLSLIGRILYRHVG